MSTRIEKIKECFHQMDLEGLNNELEEFDTLFQTNNKIFVSLMEDLFNQLKEYGETYLHVFPGEGINLKGEDKPAFRFIGNNSKSYIDIIIAYTKHDTIEFEICEDIKTELIFSQLGERITLFVDEDEKLPFYQDKQLIKDFKEGELAIKELKIIQEEVNDLSVYLDWIEKYKPLFVRNLYFDQDGLSKFQDFFGTFLGLRSLSYFTYEGLTTLARLGYAEFQNVDTSKMVDILKWLCRYEKLPAWLIIYYDNKVEANAERGYFIVDDCRIRLGELDEVLKFIHYFRFYHRRYSHEFYEAGLGFYDDFLFELGSENRGFFEANLEMIGIVAEPIQIHFEDQEPLGDFFIRQAMGLQPVYKSK